jgi:hypothetical protein
MERYIIYTKRNQKFDLEIDGNESILNKFDSYLKDPKPDNRAGKYYYISETNEKHEFCIDYDSIDVIFKYNK